MKNNIPISHALFCDCETDEEKSEFFLSGRAYDTGIAAKAVEKDIARAFFAASFVAELTYPSELRPDEN